MTADPADEAMARERAEQIREAMDSLTFRERAVLEMRMGIGGPRMTLREIGKVFRICKERVRQIHDKALRKLREPTVGGEA